MKAVVEMKFKIDNGRVLKAEKMPDGTLKLVVEVTDDRKVNDEKPLVSLFSKNDDYDADWN